MYIKLLVNQKENQRGCIWFAKGETVSLRRKENINLKGEPVTRLFRFPAYKFFLLHQYHFLCLNETASLKSIKIDTAW